VDELVRLGLARWPNVPDCFGWLALDGRGVWRIGQARETITHAATIEFIHRNYTSDLNGRWLFQNGPQRVYVDLDYTPYVWRVVPMGEKWQLVSQDRAPAAPLEGIWIDDTGQFLLLAGTKIGVLHDHDSAWFLERLCNAHGIPFTQDEATAQIAACMEGEVGGVWIESELSGPLRPVEPILREDVPIRFGFDPHPKKPAEVPGDLEHPSPK